MSSLSRGAALAAVWAIALVLGWPASDTLAVPVGGYPLGVAVNEETNRIYVALATARQVAVLAGTSGKVVAKIDVGSWNERVAVNAVTNRIYVSHFYSNIVSVIDGATNGVIATVQVGARPRPIDSDPSVNRIYVGNFEGGSVSVIDGRDHGVITSFPSPGGPNGLAVNPVTKRIYVTASDMSLLRVFDAETHAQITTIPLHGRPQPVTVNQATNRVYVGTSSGDIFVIDGNTNAVIGEIEVNAGALALAVDSERNRIFANGPRGVVVIDGATHEVIETIGAGTSVAGIGINTKTARGYASNIFEDNLTIFLQDELLRNASLDGYPRVWRVIDGHPDDRRIKGPPNDLIYEGQYAFQLVGQPGVIKQLKQQVHTSGPAMTVLYLEGFSRAEGPSADGGRYDLRARVIFTDGTSATFGGRFTKSTHGWERVKTQYTAPKPYEELIVTATYADQTGKAIFDSFHLWAEPPVIRRR